MRELVGATNEQLGKLRTETGALVSALKRPQVRGSWGEIQLRNVVRVAGMTDHVDFHAQASVDGTLRPDMTVHLPTGRDIVVDSKVPLDAYLTALEASDDDERDAHLDRHAAQLRTHLDKLATKAYHAKLARSAEVEQSALEIAAAGRELHKRCATFLESFAKAGRQLDSATSAYNDAVGSLEGRVLPQLRRLEQLGSGSENELTAPRAIDTGARRLSAA
jgi:DNA recombination protein RmuC